MTENDKLIKLLILKYASHEPMTAEEQAILDEWRQRSAEHNALPDKFRDEEWVRENLIKLDKAPSSEIWERITQQVKNEKHHSRGGIGRVIRKYGYYAAAALLLYFGFKIFTPHRLSAPSAPGKEITRTAAPPLIEAAMPSLSELAEFAAKAVAGHYDTKPALADGGYRILATGLTWSHRLVLPDGTKVWLRNTSSLSYPTAFTGDRRVVRLSGAADFEIAKDSRARPFIVETRFGSTKDESTKFSVIAYPNDAVVRVTLLEGAVKVYHDRDSMELEHPREQARLTITGLEPKRMVKSSDDAIAWQKGSFHFKDTDLRTAMRELARWYNKTVIYTDDVEGVPVEEDFDHEMRWGLVLDAMQKFETGYALFHVTGDSITISAVRIDAMRKGKSK